MKYNICYSCIPPTKIFQPNELEINFFNTLYNKLNNKCKDKITLIRMADGTLSVNFKNGYCVGKIRLQGRKHWMQIFKSTFKDYVVYKDFENHIDEWITYIYKYLDK